MTSVVHAAAVELVEPSLDRLPGYMAALEAGWSPNTTRDVSGEQLASDLTGGHITCDVTHFDA